jgi:tripartite motif-containing protein 2/3
MSTDPPGNELKEQVEEVIRCPICLENFSDPRMLPCAHTFCLKCIKAAAASNHGQFQCPLRDGTRVASKNTDSLPVNFVVRDIVDVVSKNAGKIKTN